jgi:hypothetical protein
MQPKRSSLIVGLFTLIFLTFISITNVVLADEATIKGIVLALDWDDNDNVSAVSIISEDGEEYLVVKNANGKKFLKLVDKDVIVTGSISEDSDGNKVIAINSFEVLEE